MKKILCFTLLFWIGFSLFAQKTSNNKVQIKQMNQIQRHRAIEKKALSKHKQIKAALQPSAKNKLNQVSKELLKRFKKSTKNINHKVIAEKLIRKKFAKLSKKQADLLTLYVLSDIAPKINPKKQAKNKHATQTDMANMDSLHLQASMEKKSRLMNTMSQIMKSSHSTSMDVIRNLK